MGGDWRSIGRDVMQHEHKGTDWLNWMGADGCGARRSVTELLNGIGTESSQQARTGGYRMKLEWTGRSVPDGKQGNSIGLDENGLAELEMRVNYRTGTKREERNRRIGNGCTGNVTKRMVWAGWFSMDHPAFP